MKSKFDRLSSSFDDEEKKIEDKFSKADNIFLREEKYSKPATKNTLGKTKIVKISISMTIEEFETLEDLKLSFAAVKKSVTRSEVIRTGIASLSSMKLEEVNDIHNNLKNLILQRGRSKESKNA